MSNTTRRLTPGIILLLFVLSLATAVTLTAHHIVRAETGVLYTAPTAYGSGDCSSWANACSLQTALSNAMSSDEIWVKAGAYYPGTSSDRDSTFILNKGVALYGGFVGTETNLDERNWQTNLSILSGDIDKNDTNTDGNYISETTADIQGDNAYHVVTGNEADNTSVLDGFIITAGQANGDNYDFQGGGMYNKFDGSPTLKNVTFSGNYAFEGGGIFNIFNSSPTLTNVTFSGNSAGVGGGMFNDKNSSPTLTNVTFSGNTAVSKGGGMKNEDNSNPVLTNVTFSGNSVNHSGGGLYNIGSNPALTNVTFSGNSANGGGGMYNRRGSPTLTNVTFSSNSAVEYGGGMSNILKSSPTLKNVTFSGNSAGEKGGGMYISMSSPTLTNVTFSGNTATDGGGIRIGFESNPTLTNVTFSGNIAINGGGVKIINNSSPTLTNVTFSGNTATSGGGMKNEDNSSPTLANVIMWGDSASTGSEIFNESSTPNIAYSDIQSCGSSSSWNSACGANVGGNIDVDPLLGSLADNGGFTQTHALGSGSPAIDTGSTAFCPDMDQRGYARSVDGNGDETLGCDMGAYEYASSPVSFPLTVDIVGNGSVIKNPDQIGYYFGETVTLTATADTGWTFTGWSVDASGSANPLTVPITDNTNITATFTQNEYKLSVTVDPEGMGSVAISPSQDTYHYGDEVTLTPAANPGWSFSGWSGEASGPDNPLTVTIQGDTNIIANFTQDEYTLSITVDPEGMGSVAIDPVKDTYHYGDTVTLTPAANPLWSFSGWSGDTSGTDNPLTVTIQGDTNITANFTQDEYTLSVTVDPEGMGSVAIDPVKDTYHYGDTVTLTPAANPLWSFSGWSGDASGTDNPLTVTIQGDTNITAHFLEYFEIYLPLIMRN